MVERSRITKTAAFCTQCRSRCGCTAVVDAGRLIAIEPLATHPTGAKLCPKGRAAPELVYHPDRLTRPMRRTNPKGAADPGWQPISWDQALDDIAARMASIRDLHGAEQVAFAVTTPSGTHISDSIAWIERFIRVFGSPNTIYATEICNWHKDYASRFTYGHDIGIPDFAHTDCAILWGNNPTATWLARTDEIQKGLKRGASLVVIDPRPTVFARRATQWLQVRPGSDQIVALGLANLLIANGTIDHTFATQWTNGSFLVRADTGRFLRASDVAAGASADIVYARCAVSGSELTYDLKRGRWSVDNATPTLRWSGVVQTSIGAVPCQTAFGLYADACAAYPPERVTQISGVRSADLIRAAEIIGAAKSVAYYAWNGIGQSTTATQTDRAVSILYALTGSYGRAGGNVPGAAAPFVDIARHDLLAPTQREKALGLGERPLGPGRQGWVTARDVYRAISDHAPYSVRMLVSFGTNLLVSQPDTERAKVALAALDFHVHADFFINATASFADIVLPIATSWEREGLRTGFDVSLAGQRHVQLRPAVVAPVGEARSDTDVVMGLSARLGLHDRMFNLDADAGYAHILSQTEISVDSLRHTPEGLAVAGGVTLDAHTLTTDGVPQGFPTPTRRIEVYSEQLLDAGYAPIPVGTAGVGQPAPPGFPLVLGSAKSIAYCHSQHRNITSLRRLMLDPIVEMAAADAAARSISAGDWVLIKTEVGRARARASITAGLSPGAVFGQHGWWVDGQPDTPTKAPHGMAANLNGVISTVWADPVSGSIPLRASWCEIEKLVDAGR
jgi:anaerobic selenocysteine-containing dehydrogenase